VIFSPQNMEIFVIFFLSKQKNLYTIHTRFFVFFVFFFVRSSQCEDWPKNNNLHCHLANGCGFHTIDKIVWHVLASTKINQIVKLTKLFGTFWNLLSSAHSIYLERVKPFHISHSKVNLESLVKGYKFYTTLLVKGRVIHNMMLRSTSFQNFIDIIAPLD
jgi:hypothetical protein